MDDQAIVERLKENNILYEYNVKATKIFFTYDDFSGEYEFCSGKWILLTPRKRTGYTITNLIAIIVKKKRTI